MIRFIPLNDLRYDSDFLKNGSKNSFFLRFLIIFYICSFGIFSVYLSLLYTYLEK